MGSNYLSDPLLFIIGTIFGLYILAFMLRFLFQWVRADFYNPVSQFIVKISNPLLLPLRRLIPGFAGIDIASVIIILFLTAVKQSLILLIKGYGLSGLAVAVYTIADSLQMVLNLFFFTILIQMILSWVAPQQYNPASLLLYKINEPLLRPARRLLPPISGIDLSPMLVMILLKVTQMLLIPPIVALAQ